MGQLEAYGINEMYLTGMMVGLMSNYVAEEQESDTFESFKSYFYSVAFAASRKSLPLDKQPLLIFTNDGGSYRSWSFLGLNKLDTVEMTKLIDNFPIWQDPTLSNFNIDERVLALQGKYGW